jgi:hypothetical protein
LRKTNCFLILILILASQPGKAQSSKGSSYDHHKPMRRTHVFADEPDTARRIVARFNFTGMLDPYDENASVGGEYKFAAGWSAGGDVAYIFNSAYVPDLKKTNGYIVRPFIRFYPDTWRRGFIEVQLHYKYASYQLTDWVGKDVTNGVPAYEEFTTFEYKKKAWGFHFNAGSWTNLSANNKLRLEFFIGLGMRFKKQYTDNALYTPRKAAFMELYNPRYNTVVLPMGIRLVYDLKSFPGAH